MSTTETFDWTDVPGAPYPISMTSSLLRFAILFFALPSAGCAASHGLDGLADGHPAGIACGGISCVAGVEHCLHCPEGPICSDADATMESDLWTPHSECAGVGLAPFGERPGGAVRHCDDASDCAPDQVCGVYSGSDWVTCISTRVASPDDYERACRDDVDCGGDELCVIEDEIARCRSDG